MFPDGNRGCFAPPHTPEARYAPHGCPPGRDDPRGQLHDFRRPPSHFPVLAGECELLGNLQAILRHRTLWHLFLRRDDVTPECRPRVSHGVGESLPSSDILLALLALREFVPGITAPHPGDFRLAVRNQPRSSRPSRGRNLLQRAATCSGFSPQAGFRLSGFSPSGPWSRSRISSSHTP